MLGLAVVVVLAVVLVALAGGHPWRSPFSAGDGALWTCGAQYTLVTDLSGDTLRPGSSPNAMRYFVGGDPTQGFVSYGKWDDLVTYDAASQQTIIRLGAPAAQPRRSIRLVSQNMHNSGLFIIDASHVPAGLGTWPSFWLTACEPPGSAWACHGEIDVIEGVNSVDAASSHNTTTLHTSDHAGPSGERVACDQTGVSGITNPACGAGAPGSCGCDGASVCPYAGCGVVAGPASFGAAFNTAAGGVYACELTPAGAVTVWFFPRAAIPADITMNTPNPMLWPTTNRIAFNPCPGTFKFLQVIINTTLCGAWAGAKYPGGWAQCVNDVQTAPLPEAYWAIRYVKIFRRTDAPASDVAPEPKPWKNGG
jgi:hypothetical protein